jgi:predicted transcriptional regulator
MVPDEKLRRHAIAVRMSDEELEGLRKIADRRKTPVSFLIREGISLVIKRYSK